MAALLAPAFQDLPTSGSFHAHAETVCLGPAPPVGLKGPFQGRCSLSEIAAKDQSLTLTRGRKSSQAEARLVGGVFLLTAHAWPGSLTSL